MHLKSKTKKLLFSRLKSGFFASSKGFTLVEMAMVLIVIGLVIALGVPLMRTVVTNIKYSNSRDIVQAAVDSVESWTAGNNKIPAANFNTVVKNPNDAFLQSLIYVYDYNAANTTNICGMSTTAIDFQLAAGACANCPPTCPSTCIQKVAFAFLSHAGNNDNTKYSTVVSTANATCGNSWVGNGYTSCTTATSPTNQGTVTITPNTTYDLVQWVTMDELRTKIGCQGAELRIANNELPYGYNNTSYTATIYASGGVPYTANPGGTGQYKWCVQTPQASLMFSNLSCYDNNNNAFPTTAYQTVCDPSTQTNWVQSDYVKISGSPLIIVAYNSNPGTNNTYAFISIQGNNSSSPASTASCSSNTIWSCVNAVSIQPWNNSTPYNQGQMVSYSQASGGCNGSICTFLNTQPSNSNPPTGGCTTNALCYNGTCNANGWQCYPMWSASYYYPSGSNTLTLFVADNGSNSAQKKFTFTVNPM